MSIFSTGGGRPVPISDAALAEAFRSASVHDDDEQKNPKLLLTQDLEHSCYELYVQCIYLFSTNKITNPIELFYVI